MRARLLLTLLFSVGSCLLLPTDGDGHYSDMLKKVQLSPRS